MRSTFYFSLLAVVAPALATFDPYPRLTNCPVPSSSLNLSPPALAALGTPPQVPAYVGLSLGYNSYTCNTTSNTWSNTGVTSVLFDVSCLVTTPSFSTLQDESWKAWNESPASFTVEKYITQLSQRPVNTTKYPIVLATHSFVPEPSYGPAVYPAFDFTSFTHNATDKVVLVKVAGFNGETPEDVAWLQVNRISGGPVSKVFRVMTKGGMPPASCKAGDKDLKVRYSGTYWFYV